MTINNTTDLVRAARKDDLMLASYGEKADYLQFAAVMTPAGVRLEVELRLKAYSSINDLRIMRTSFFRGFRRISRAEAEKLFEVPVDNNQIEGEAMDSFGNFPDDPNPTYRR